MKCTEGQARQHAALVLKEFLPNSEDVGFNVDPAFRELSFQEQAGSDLASTQPQVQPPKEHMISEATQSS